MQILFQYAMSFLGLPYRWGGDDPINGFDCSGLVQEILASIGADPPGDQTAQSLYDFFIRPENHIPGVGGLGALCFYGRSAQQITHIAFAIDSFRMLEAGGGGSATQSAADAANQNAYVRIRPIQNRRDLVAVLMPRYGVAQ